MKTLFIVLLMALLSLTGKAEETISITVGSTVYQCTETGETQLPSNGNQCRCGNAQLRPTSGEHYFYDIPFYRQGIRIGWATVAILRSSFDNGRSAEALREAIRICNEESVFTKPQCFE